MALKGLKVIEFAGLAPGPFAGLVLADNGASVTRIDRPSSTSSDVLCRGKRSIAINSKVQSGRELLKQIISSADVVIDPFRPGVMERMGLGPEVFLGDGGLNKKLIYARIVGFPRNGPHKDMAGHDINYVALSGILSMLPGDGKPTFPLNLLADFAGGGVMCALGILLALIERGMSGRGQVVNADMVSGTRYLSTFPLIHTLLPRGITLLGGERGSGLLDGGAPFYNVYICKDGGWMSVGCLEQQFFKAFIETFNRALPNDYKFQGGWIPTAETQTNRTEWPKLAKFLEMGFLTNTRKYWTDTFHGTEACTVPVLSPQEAATLNGSVVPTPHPMLSSSRNRETWGNPTTNAFVVSPGSHTDEVLKEFGINDVRIRKLKLEGAVENTSVSSCINSKL
ncbi:CoA-transferase family III [Cyathus striatus]|nr:CoA-transferase family III [Cyathus striatus]